jgi:hypothetical protein
LVKLKISNIEIYDFTFFRRHQSQLLLEESHSYQCNSLSHTPFLFLIHGFLPSPKLKHNIPFQPLKTKKQLYEKIKFKKPLSVLKTDKIANLHDRKFLRTSVRLSVFDTWFSAFAQTSFVILPNPP